MPTDDSGTAIRLERAIPILRMFDEAKAREFYLDFLGFSIEFEHRYEADLPLYLGLRRDGLQVHLSEHHGDASPGATLFVPCLLYTSPSPRDGLLSRMPSSA